MSSLLVLTISSIALIVGVLGFNYFKRPRFQKHHRLEFPLKPDGTELSFAEMVEYVRANYSEAKQKEFFKGLNQKMFPVFVKKLLEFRESGEISSREFEERVRDLVNRIEE